MGWPQCGQNLTSALTVSLHAGHVLELPMIEPPQRQSATTALPSGDNPFNPLDDKGSGWPETFRYRVSWPNPE